uniref:SRPBCC family protein n=1 Tax=Desulfobacca acetoxidans TaxID=60893 RepID=A0A7C5ALV9_9BACT
MQFRKGGEVGQVCVNAQIPAAAQEVWETIRDFGGVDRWAPNIVRLEVRGSGVGALRTATFKDGGRVVERLENLSDATRSLSYAILETPLPMEGCVSSLTVKELGPNRCEVEWYSTFGAKGAAETEVARLLEKIYRVALGRLARLCQRNQTQGD